MRRALCLAILAIWTATANAGSCAHPIYAGLRFHMYLRFTGDDGNNLYSESGVLDTGASKYMFKTTHSNGHADEYITIDVPKLSNPLPNQKKQVDSLVMRKNDDFTDSQRHDSDFLITPGLPLQFYYLSYDRPPVDDTWKLIGCNQAARPKNISPERDFLFGHH